jgi:hypothetical protein
MKNQENIVINDVVYKRYIVHRFSVDVMSTDYLINASIEAWKERSTVGQWVKENCVEISSIDQSNQLLASRDVIVFGYMTEKQHTYYMLKFPENRSMYV